MTERLLAPFRERKIPVIGFVNEGRQVQFGPAGLRQILDLWLDSGADLGNHTYSHPFLCFRSRRSMAREIDRTQEMVRKITGESPTLFRPPYGVRWLGLWQVLGERGLRLIMWSDSGLDWKLGAEAIVGTAVKGLRPGAILLLHDGHGARPANEVDRSHTVKALPRIIDWALREGFSFVPVRHFLSEQ